VYFTQDWHPADHVSFYTNHPDTEPLQVIEIDGRSQVMWPPHCVQDTAGAEILIPLTESAKTVRKGVDRRYDSYSGFADDGGHKTELGKLLQRDGIKRLIIYGLATDYCVKATVLDALEAGYQVELALDLCRGVSPQTTDSAIQEMKAKGATIISC
jgi:nicotinamidase/pyrazinamidase